MANPVGASALAKAASRFNECYPDFTSVGNRLSLGIRVQAGMKSTSCIIWVLGLLLAIASVDTIPDPPAVNPRSVSAASVCELRGDVCERLNSGWFISSLVQVRWIAFTSAYEPKLPTDWIALTGLATDPSPPTL